MLNQNLFAGAEVISCYTAEQAVEDGVLIDGRRLGDNEEPKWLDDGRTMRDYAGCKAGAGYLIRRQFGGAPVYLTRALHDLIERAVAHPRWCNDWSGVVHDILWMSRGAVRRASQQARIDGIGRAAFLVIITGCGRRRNHRLDAVISGDGLTFSLEGED